jgi:glycosyltransferase involved in cell wall biosynthesis
VKLTVEGIIITEMYAPVIGGAETYAKAIAEKLSGWGMRMTVYALGSRNNAVDNMNGVTVKRFRKIRVPSTVNRFVQKNRYEKIMCKTSIAVQSQITPVDYIEGLVIDPMSPSGLVSLMVDKTPSIYHSIGSMGSEHWYAYLASRLKDKNWVATPFIHTDVSCYYKPCILRALRYAFGIFVCTDVEKNFLVSNGVSPEKIFVTGVGVDYEVYANGNGVRFRKKYGLGDSFVILFMGRLTRLKGLHDLIKAMDFVLERAPNAKLVIAGTPIGTDNVWRKLMEKHASNIVFVGTILGQEKIDAFAAADVFAVPSIDQAIGTVYLEAWCCGKPVISADTPIMEEIIGHEDKGLLVRFGDVKGIADAILRLKEDETLRITLGMNGLKHVKIKYGWTTIMETVKRVYSEALNLNL